MLRLRLLPLFCPDETGAAQAALSPEAVENEQVTVQAAAEEGDSSNAAPESTAHSTAAPDTAAESSQPPQFHRLQRHTMELRRQEGEIKKLIPGFSLDRELKRNPELLRLTAPGSPLTLAEALTAVNLPRLAAMREARLIRLVQESAAKSMATGQYRPAELRSLSGEAVGSAPRSAQERERLKERIRGGERIRP